MEAQPDFRDLLALFNEQRVEYLIVGAYALAFHGVPRFTGDLDLYVRPDPANAQRVLKALEIFGFRFPELTADDFVHSDRVVQLGVAPVRVDLLTSLSGLTWDEADRGKAAGVYGDVPVSYLGRDQYIANKRAVGRLKDLADIEALGEG